MESNDDLKNILIEKTPLVRRLRQASAAANEDEKTPTDGPWWQGFDDARTAISMANIRWTIYDQRDRVIAFVVAGQGIGPLEAEANGDLIRRAPEMAERVKELEAENARFREADKKLVAEFNELSLREAKLDKLLGQAKPHVEATAHCNPGSKGSIQAGELLEDIEDLLGFVEDEA